MEIYAKIGKTIYKRIPKEENEIHPCQHCCLLHKRRCELMPCIEIDDIMGDESHWKIERKNVNLGKDSFIFHVK